ncbi:MAG: hypothetical protein V2I97_24980 [Desulfococcaceae bacterium]|jgi:hypothetical protein|nr:hypothetical protein [Desulfococcaceae bacterium]
MLRILIFFLILEPLPVFAADQPVTPLIPPDVMKKLQEKNAKTPPDISPQPGSAPQSPPSPDTPPVMRDIHDIKPPVSAGPDPVIFCYILGGLLLIALIAGIVYRFRHRKKRVSAKTAPSLPPHEAALLSLNELSDVENTEGKYFYFRLSAIVRHYLEGRFGINAPEMTTEELMPCVDRLEIQGELRKSLKNVFRCADPVKFAGAHAIAKNMQEHLLFARKFVKETSETAVPERGKSAS